MRDRRRVGAERMVGSSTASPAWRRRAVVLIAAVLVAGGCAQIERIKAVPAADARRATVSGLHNVRYYAGDPSGQIAEYRRAFEREVNYFRSIGRPLPSANY